MTGTSELLVDEQAIAELEALSPLERLVTRLSGLLRRRGGRRTVWVTAGHARRIVEHRHAVQLRVAVLEREIAEAREQAARAEAEVLAMRAERLAWHGAGLLDDDLVASVLDAAAVVTVAGFLAETFPTDHES